MNSKKPEDDDITLEILKAIDERSDVSQRHLSRRLGIALGLTNSYLKRCARKGLVKIQAAPANRYLYYLTPKGFVEKGKLTASYFSRSFSFYREASEACLDLYDQCAENGWSKIALYGTTELTEIAFLRAWEKNIDVICVIDVASKEKEFLGKKIRTDLRMLKGAQACMLTELTNSLEIYQKLIAKMGDERVLVPNVLDVSRELKISSRS